MLIVGDLVSSLAYGLELAARDPTPNVIRPLREALQTLGRGLLAVYAPQLELDRLPLQGQRPSPLQGGDPEYTPLPSPVQGGDPRQGYRVLNAEELAAVGLENWPPTWLFLRVAEVLGVLCLPSRAESTLTPDGRLQPSRRLPFRGLLLGSLRRLVEGFRRAFPEARLPAAPPGEAVHFELLSQWSQAFTPGARTLVPRLQQEATALGFFRWWSEQASSEVSWSSRLAFWSTTPQKLRAADLRAEVKARQAGLEELWGELLGLASRAAATLPALQLRETLTGILELLAQVRAVEGRGPQACTVRYKAELLELAVRMREILREGYGLAAPFGAFLRELERIPPAAAAAPTLGLGPVPQPVLLGALRARFGSLAELARLETLRQQHAQVDYHRQVVDASIGLWDRLNFWRQTPEKERRGELTRHQASLRGELEALEQRVTSDFLRAAEVFPPLVAHLLLPPLEQALQGLEARWRSTTRKDSQGREEEVSELELVGHTRALTVAREYATEFARVFGALPGPARLIELWAG